MNLNISPINNYKLNFTSIERQYNNPDNIAREDIRQNMEKFFLPSPEYDTWQLRRMNIDPGTLREEKEKIRNISSKQKMKEGANKDILNILKNAKIYAAKEVVPNKLYTGQSFITYDSINKVDALKEAGIKTIVGLIPSDLYEEKARQEGINFTYLSSIGHRTLKTSSFRVIEELINNPKLYKEDYSYPISDLKQYVNILNNNDENFEGPVYMGCQNGTTRTFFWTQVYKILKDAPQDEPLSKERVEKLGELLELYSDNN